MSGNHVARNRSAFTLIEILVVLSLTTALMGIAIGLVNLASDSNQNAQQSFLHRQEIRRFANELRRDMHQSLGSEVSDDQRSVTITSQDQRIRYQVDSSPNSNHATLSREVIGTDGESLSSDSYSVMVVGQIEVRQLKQYNAVQWTITDGDRPDMPLQIIASHGAIK